MNRLLAAANTHTHNIFFFQRKEQTREQRDRVADWRETESKRKKKEKMVTTFELYKFVSQINMNWAGG